MYRLDREELATERARAQESAFQKYLFAIGNGSGTHADRTLEQLRSEPYALAVLQYVNFMWEAKKPQMPDD